MKLSLRFRWEVGKGKRQSRLSAGREREGRRGEEGVKLTAYCILLLPPQVPPASNRADPFKTEPPASIKVLSIISCLYAPQI